jgi:predicted RNA-binding protein YlxR (DUF448 family)
VNGLMVNQTQHVPERTCIGCRQVRPAPELCLLVAPEGSLTIAPRASTAATGRHGKRGRGAWVHPSCFAKALSNGGINRAFRRQIEVSSREALLAQMLTVFGRSLNVQGNSP